jgi:hypothetical protein
MSLQKAQEGSPAKPRKQGKRSRLRSQNISSELIGKIRVKPHEQPRLSLGSYTTDQPPKGFSIEIHPDPEPKESIVTEITKMGITRRYELILHVANYGNKAVTAKVWQL